MIGRPDPLQAADHRSVNVRLGSKRTLRSAAAMSALCLNKRMLTQAIYMHTLVSPITLGFAFGLFGTNDPGVGNLG